MDNIQVQEKIDATAKNLLALADQIKNRNAEVVFSAPVFNFEALDLAVSEVNLAVSGSSQPTESTIPAPIEVAPESDSTDVDGGTATVDQTESVSIS